MDYTFHRGSGKGHTLMIPSLAPDGETLTQIP
jgi:hypothetical protein